MCLQIQQAANQINMKMYVKNLLINSSYVQRQVDISWQINVFSVWYHYSDVKHLTDLLKLHNAAHILLAGANGTPQLICL